MGQLPNFESKRLVDLCLPRTHDSGTYALTDQLAPEMYELEPLRYLYSDWSMDSIEHWGPWLIPAVSFGGLVGAAALATIRETAIRKMLREMLHDWGKATNRSILQQLEDGIRMLDLRICSSDGELRTFHGCTGPLLSDVLSQIKQFLQSTKREVVLINASHMSSGHKRGLSPAEHEAFANLILATLGEHLYPYASDGGPLEQVPMGKITGVGGQSQSKVVFFYDDDYRPNLSEAAQHLLWPQAEYNRMFYDAYEEEVTNNAMSSTLEKIQEQQRNLAFLKSAQEQYLYSLNWILTPQTEDILADVKGRVEDLLNVFKDTHTSGSLHQLVQQINPSLRAVVDSLSREERNKINVISVDFHEESEAVVLAIALSTERAIATPPTVTPPAQQRTPATWPKIPSLRLK
jgi:hypothetical protein